MLNFYDVLFDGPDYKTASVVGDKKSGKLVNSYVLKRNRKNFIKSLYVLRYDDLAKDKLSAENYITIACNEKGFHVYNEFSRSGIVVKGTEPGNTKKLTTIKHFCLVAEMKYILK